MKKLLLAGVAVLAVSAAAPAKAEGVDLGLGGFFIGYGLYTSQDEAAAGSDLRNFNLRKETEIHFNGETTLDNGLTVGAHVELNADRALDAGEDQIEESYAYMSGGWGRVNVGEEDGAAFLLQVAAPSADDNIDGLRPDINALELGATGLSGGTVDVLDYAADATRQSNKLTYITPLFSGFQAGVSITPEVTDADQSSGAAAAQDDDLGAFGTAYDVAARYQGNFGATDVTVGGGWERLTTENDAALGTAVGSDDRNVWNAGVRLGFADFGLGGNYMKDDNGVNTDGDTTTWVAGADYKMGAFKLGLSYYDRNDEVNAGNGFVGTGETDTTRWTAGVGYQYGPGMSLNGSVARVNVEDTTSDESGTQVAVGTRIDF